jgi:hypothetical protein
MKRLKVNPTSYRFDKMQYFRFAFCLLFVFLCFSCNRKSTRTEDDWSALLDSIYFWDVKPELTGALMFLDVAYQTCDSCLTDFVTMSIAKHKSGTRPDWIAVIFPDNIIQEEGVFLFFRNSDEENNQSTEEVGSIRVNVGEHRKDTYIVRLKDGYALDENNEKVDILKKFQESDMVYFMIFLPDGGHKTIAFPLKNFKKQYNELE